MASGIVQGLRAAGFAVDLATRGDEGARLALADPPDVIVLDLLLPEQTGFAVLEQLQGRCAAPVLVLTARTELADRLKCFALGAVDFVAKPFFVEELVARIRSRLRVREDAPRRVVGWGEVVVDIEARTVRAQGADVTLTRNEFDILAYLLERPGRAVTRASLAERTALPFGERDARTVDTHVARVRKKLGPAAIARSRALDAPSLRLWRGLSKRVLLASVVCGLVGLGSSSILVGVTSRDVLLRNTLPVWIFAWTTHEQPRCEASPETWTLSLVQGTAAWAYDADTRLSRNPLAPPLEAELAARAPHVGDRAVEQHGPMRGGSAIYRSASAGPCSVVVVSWTRRLSLVDASQALFAGAVLAAVLAAALGFLAIARPLALRVARLRRAAERVGESSGYAPAEVSAPDDDLGELSTILDRAHARIRSDAARLEQRQADLQRYLDDVTHDLRTPIASLQLALEGATDAAAEPERARLNGALKDVVYLGALTSNLRLASQLREGWSPHTASTPVDLGETIERVAARAGIVARRGGLSLDIAVPDEPVRAQCDPVAAEQAIGNLVDNAVAYGDPGGHVVLVLERDGARFVLRVEDDGPGVRASELPRLGERTFRSDEARQRDPRGSGLGLAITTEVCERCGWELSFEPAEPTGLRVTIRGSVVQTS